MHHRLAQVFCARLPAIAANRNLVRRAVVLHDDGIIDRNIRRALLEITHGISASLHRVGDQAVGQRYSAFGIVHETALYIIPAIQKARTICRRKRTKLESLVTLLAKRQHAFALAHIAFMPHNSVVLWPKALA